MYSVARWVNAAQVVSTSKVVDISSVNIGESMIVFLELGSTTVTVTPPAGWTLLFTKTTMGSRACVGYYKTKSDAGETSATFTVSASTGIAHSLVGITGAAPANWIVGPLWTRTVHGTTLTNVIDGVTTTGSETLALIASFEATTTAESPNTISGVDNGFTELGYLAQSSAIETIWVGTKSIATAVDVGDTTVTYRNTQASNGAGIMIGIPEAPYVPMGTAIDLGNGASAYLSFLDELETRQPTASVRMIRSGFATAADFIATPGSTMAHRGGSLYFPDMSEYAYDQAILYGFGALEFSAQRTSDGWWFGSHNADINEVAGTTGLPNISSMTRAEIEAYANVDNPMTGHSSRPFFGLEEFLSKYGNTHVLVMDPKNAIAQNTEFMDICESIVDKARLIWKYYLGGVGSTTASTAALAAINRGWAGTWGYAYDTDVASGAFAEHSVKSQWTILGMNIGASQGNWDTAVAVGKPVIGHIANSQTDYATAITKGADMVQCADTKFIVPVSI